MSEKPRCAPSQSKGSNKAGPGDDGEPFSSRFIKAASDFGSLLQDVGGVRTLSNLISEREALQEDLRRKEAEIERLRVEVLQTQQHHGEEMSELKKEKTEIKAAIDLMMKEVGIRYGKWDEEMNSCANKSAELSVLKSDFRPCARNSCQVVEQKPNAS